MQNADQIISDLKEYLGVTRDVELANLLGVSANVINNWKARNSVNYAVIINKFPDVFCLDKRVFKLKEEINNTIEKKGIANKKVKGNIELLYQIIIDLEIEIKNLKYKNQLLITTNQQKKRTEKKGKKNILRYGG